MFMTDGEIITSYRRAENPVEQVGILADLNGCRKYDMQVKLAELGLIPMPPKPQRKTPSKSKYDFDQEAARELFEQGLPDEDIAKAVGCSRYKLVAWRREAGLLRLSARSRKSRIDDETAMAMYLDGKSDKEIAAVFGMTSASIEHWRRKRGLKRKAPGRPKTFDEALALAMLQEGKTDQEIAKAIGVRVRVVQDWRTDKGFWRPSGRTTPVKAGLLLPVTPKTPPSQENALKAPLVFHGTLAGVPIKVTIEIGGES